MAYELPDWMGTISKTETVIEAVHDARIFGIEKRSDDTFTITECCDNYYDITLTKQQLIDLANELIALTNEAS